MRSPAFGPFLKGLRTLAAKTSLEKLAVASPPASLAAALDAPCTEVFTGSGTEPAFADAVGAFKAAVDAEAPPGYHGAAVCDSGASGDGDGSGRVVKLVIGWDSREAHLEAKAQKGGELPLSPDSPRRVS